MAGFSDVYALSGEQTKNEDDSGVFQSSLLRAADNHNLLSSGKSWADDLGESLSNIPKFTALSLASGVNQLYNIIPTVGSWLGADIEESNFQQKVQEYDDDLGKYYTENKQYIDLGGFIASSLVPGTLGIKALRAGQGVLATAGQTGIFGENIAKSVGLLASSEARNLKLATDAIKNTQTVFSSINTNTLKALGAGVGQSALEGAAFEIAVASTLYNSPVLKDQDFGDIVSHVLIGAALTGGIGGIISGAKILGTVKKARVSTASEEFPFTHISETVEQTAPSGKIQTYLEDLNGIPLVDETADNASKLNSLATKKQDRINLLIREQLGKISDSDQTVADLLSTSLKGLDRDTALGNIWQLQSAARLSESSASEKLINVLDKKVSGFKATPEELDTFGNLSTKYLKVHGEDAGKITAESPVIRNLADELKSGEKIEILFNDSVKAGSKTYSFKGVKDFDVLAAGHLDVEARQILAAKSKPLTEGAVVFENDLPFLTKALFEDTKNLSVKLADGSGNIKFNSIDELKDFIIGKKLSLANKALYADIEKVQGVKDLKAIKAKEELEAAKLTGVTDPKIADLAGTKVVKTVPDYTARTQEEIAKLVDVKNEYLSGIIRGEEDSSLFAFNSYQKEYNKALSDKGIRNPASPEVDLFQQPSIIKLTYDTKPVQDIDGNLLEGIAAIKQQQRIYQDSIDRVVAASIPAKFYNQLTEWSDKLMHSVNPLGAGPKFFSFGNGNYGTAASAAENTGRVVIAAIKEAQANVSDLLTPGLIRIGASQKAAIELETALQTIRGTAEKYVYDEIADTFVLRSVKQYEDAIRAGQTSVKPPVFTDVNIKRELLITDPDVKSLLKLHIEINGQRIEKLNPLRSAEGYQNARDPLTLYAPARNPKDYPYIGFVVDDSVTGTGHSRMLYAATDKDLQGQIASVKEQFPEFKVLTKGEAEDYYKKVGQFEYERTLSENYIDAALGRKGVSAPFLIRTDPKVITEDFLAWHLQREASTVRELVSAKYYRQFEELRRLGEQSTDIATSKYGGSSLVKYAESGIDNPYVDYIKTALGISKQNEYPYWTSIQKTLDSGVTTLFRSIGEVRAKAKSIDDLAGINTLLTESGYKGVYYDGVVETLANHTAPRGALSSYVQKSNSLLSLFALRLDPINALNNLIGSNVLRGTELSAVLRSINKGDSEAVGALADLTRISVPGTDKTIFSPGKLLSNSFKAFHDPEQRKLFEELGFDSSIRNQYLDGLDTIALTGVETTTGLTGKLNAAYNIIERAGEKGTKLTGNSLAESLNRFTSYYSIKQITDVAVDRGYLSAKEAISYINTFVNRVEGNYLASQRPLLFQGPVGQAIGLFQTYQFNFLQQLFRHVGEGSAKDAAVLLGLQSSIYGLNGLPAFSAINTHIIGNASGNKNHTDAYSTIYGAAGKQAGDWLTYGISSNFLLHPDLKLNLYTRGDLNPRNLTLVPINPLDVPVIAATGKFFSNLFDTAKSVGGGADITGTLLRGLEHNGVSRPLAGLAQTLEAFNNPYTQAFSTTSKGNLVASNDLVSLATLGRLAGAKPLDEALAKDAIFRLKAYAAKDSDRIEKLGEVIKTKVQAGEQLSPDEVTSFTESYVKSGGKQQNFNKFILRQTRNATTSQSNLIRETLGSSYGTNLQKLLGGYELKDLSE